MSIGSRENLFSISRSINHPMEEGFGTLRVSDTTVMNSAHSLRPSPSLLTVNTRGSADVEENVSPMESALKKQKSRIIEIIFAANSVTDREPPELQTNKGDEPFSHIPSPFACDSTKRESNRSRENPARVTNKLQVYSSRKDKALLLNDLTNLPQPDSGPSSLEKKKHSQMQNVMGSQNEPRKVAVQHLGCSANDNRGINELTNGSCEKNVLTTEAGSDWEDQCYSGTRTTLSISDLQNAFSTFHEELKKKQKGLNLPNEKSLQKVHQPPVELMSNKTSITNKRKELPRNERQNNPLEQFKIQLKDMRMKKRNSPGFNLEATQFEKALRRHTRSPHPSKKLSLSLNCSQENAGRPIFKQVKSTTKNKSVCLEKSHKEKRSSDISFCVNDNSLKQESLQQNDHIFRHTAQFWPESNNKLKRDLQIIVQKLTEKTENDQRTILQLKKKKDQYTQRKKELGDHLNELTVKRKKHPTKLDLTEIYNSVKCEESIKMQQELLVHAEQKREVHNLKTVEAELKNKLEQETARLKKLAVLYEILSLSSRESLN